MTWLVCLLPLTASAQATYSSEELEEDSLAVDINEVMYDYVEELKDLSIVANFQIQVTDNLPVSPQYAKVLKDKVRVMQDYLLSIDVRWNTFTATMQSDIAASDELMELMAQFEIYKAAVGDSISRKEQQCEAIADFVAAEAFIYPQDTTYYRLYKKAFAYSLMKKTAKSLESLKSREQVIAGHIEESYDKARAAADMLPELRGRMMLLEEKYSNLKTISGEIQALAYQPLIIRIKDYLIGMACIAILILFINLVISKYKAFKVARRQMKKYEEMMKRNGSGNSYPTI